MESITHTPVGSSPVAISYTRDSAGNPLYMVDSAGETTYETEYEYDPNSRLSAVTYPGQSELPQEYDWVGNRVTPGSMEYNEADQLVEWPGQHVYAYDSAGNLHYEYDSSGQTVQRTYTYDSAGLLSSVVHAGIGTSYMAWDADGNRVSFTSSTDANNPYLFVYDPTAGIPAVLEEVTPSGSVYYIREPEGALIARISGSDTKYYHFDAVGSTRLLTDGDGAVTDTYAYDAWGQLLSHTGDTQQPYQYVGQLGYYTHYQDENLALLQLGVRMHEAEMGRFTQRDPVRRDRHSAYPYTDDRPTALTDPSGKLAPALCLAIPLAWKVWWGGYAIGRGAMAGYYVYICASCLIEMYNLDQAMEEELGDKSDRHECCPSSYDHWRKTSKPYQQCADVCAEAVKQGLQSAVSAYLRGLRCFCRSKPIWLR